MIGYRLKQVAFVSGLLLFSFGTAMTISFGIKTPFDYSVWIGMGACFLLSGIDNYCYSLDEILNK